MKAHSGRALICSFAFLFTIFSLGSCAQGEEDNSVTVIYDTVGGTPVAPLTLEVGEGIFPRL